MSKLINNIDLAIELFQRLCDLSVSKQFVECANQQLTELFEQRTGLKINKHISYSLSGELLNRKRDKISSLGLHIYVNHNWNPVTILWKSKSGRIYDVNDVDIDCADIEFWFEDLDPILYHKQLYPKAELPFKLQNLSYELVVTRLNMECTVEMELKTEDLSNAQAIVDKTDKFIDNFNTTSEKKDRKDGVVHNWTRRIEENKLIYEIDTGFSGPVFIKKLLQFLSKLNAFEKVEIL